MRRFLFVVLLGVSTASAHLQAMPPSAYVLASAEQLTLEQAATRLQAKVGGRVLAANVVATEEKGTVYEIKILLKPGKVKVYWLNPVTGEVL